MDKIYRYILSPLSFLLTMSVFTVTADDSIPIVKELEEVVVKAERGWIEKDKIVFIPSRKEKKLSNSPETLIESMHLPMLKVMDGRITTVGGERVEIYINGLKAEPTDLSSFWPSDAMRVEYLENPMDPKFLGSSRVVNFIMHKYEVGGNTSFQYRQNIPNSGRATASSKFAYRRLTAGVMASAGYMNDHQAFTESETTYSDLYYRNQYYSELTFKEKLPICSNDKNTIVGLSGLLQWDKFEMTHNVYWEWQDNFSKSETSTEWNPSLFSSSNGEWCEKTIYNRLAAQGEYYYRPNKKWNLAAGWWYTHLHEGVDSQSETADLPIIYNSAIEEADVAKFLVLATFMQSNNMQFQARFGTTNTWHNTHYTGSADDVSRLFRNENSGYLTWYWHPVSPISFSLQPGFSTILNRTGGISTTSATPTMSGTLTWNPSRKMQLSAYCNFRADNPSASNYSSVLVRMSELLWAQGNPYLKPSSYWSATLSALWMPADWVSLNGTLFYNKTLNPYLTTYTPAPEDKGGLIMTSVNTGSIQNIHVIPDINFYLLNHLLNINLSPSYTHFIAHPYTNRVHYNSFYLSGSADYTLGNCRFKVDFTGPRKSMTWGGTGTEWVQGDLNFSFSWGNGHLYFQARVDNILHKKTKVITDQVLGNFDTHEISRRNGRCVKLTLSYKFGYGKRFRDNLNLSSGESVDSSIVGKR